MTTKSSSQRPESDASRYQIVRTLGEGGAGTVYLASDRETGEQLALKKLFRMDQKSVARFKREFRALANLHHPNLIKLYDLSRGPDAWFLTMEFVDGLDLRSRLRSTSEPRAANEVAYDATHIAQVIDTFYQLACGVQAVHRAGMLHRDLKPSNVLVAKTGRVVVLDFGLVRELDEAAPQWTQDGLVAGTPAYMPPEQATGRTLSEASDWYAFGAMLYETLSGRLPIAGHNATQLLQRKLRDAPVPLTPDTGPSALRELCQALLQRELEARPSGDDVLALLAQLNVRMPHPEADGGEGPTPKPRHSSPPLFGRDPELAQLRAAFASACAGETVVVHVRGTSGSGKSSLVEHFLDELPLASDALLLRSRCYEREAMPFKALDGAIDVLVAELARLDDLDVAHLLPSGIGELAQLFPALERLHAVRRLMAGKKPSGGAADLRRRAERALRELLQRLAARRTVVLWIDDLHWGDLDSASVLRAWLDQRTRTALLLVFSYRSAELETSSCLRVLLPQLTAADTDLALELSPLPDGDVRALCTERFAARDLPAALVERIVLEAQGNAFLAQQLSALAIAKLARGDVDVEAVSVEELVLRTSALLDAPARALLNVLAIAGRPIAPSLALAAAAVQHEGRAQIHALQALRLVRTRDVAGRRLLEVYHDRVREAVQASLSLDERALVHAHLLEVVEHAGDADPDWLHVLALGAGQRASALQHGLAAAERASASLAFERAAELYTTCLTLNDAPSAAAQLWLQLAAALTRCRRGVKAAEAYLEATKHVTGLERMPLLQLAASHFLRSGRFEEGELLVRSVLTAFGLEVPETTAGLIAAIAWERARCAWLESKTKPRASSDAQRTLQARAELYGMLSVETQIYTPLRAALFQARAMRMALETGDSTLLVRCWCLTAASTCLSGTPRAAQRSAGLLQRAQGLLQTLDSPSVQIELHSARALCAMLLGQPAEVLEPSYAVDRLHESRNTGGAHGDYFYMFAVHVARIGALQSLGRHSQANREVQEFLVRARAADNRAAEWLATVSVTTAEQVSDGCTGSRARLDAEYAQLPRTASGVLHALHLIAVMRAGCVTGDFAWALERVAELWEDYLRSPVHRSAYLACLSHIAHARLLLNHHVASGARGSGQALVRADMRQLARLPAMRSRDSALLRLRARLALLRGQRETAVRLLRASAALLEAADCRDEYERDRYALGYLCAGAEGQQLRAAAEQGLLALGVSRPLADARQYYPELMGVAPNTRP